MSLRGDVKVTIRRPTYAELKRELERLVSECCQCERCGHIQAEPNWCHLCRHRVSMPGWARELVGERERLHAAALDAVGLLDEAIQYSAQRSNAAPSPGALAASERTCKQPGKPEGEE